MLSWLTCLITWQIISQHCMDFINYSYHWLVQISKTIFKSRKAALDLEDIASCSPATPHAYMDDHACNLSTRCSPKQKPTLLQAGSKYTKLLHLGFFCLNKVCPLYFQTLGTNYCFASEIKTVHSHYLFPLSWARIK